MGAQTARDLVEYADFDQGLIYHLRVNHFPSLPASLLDACKDAIEAFHDEDYGRLVTLPDVISYRGSQECPAHEIVKLAHLDAWVVQDDY